MYREYVQTGRRNPFALGLESHNIAKLSPGDGDVAHCFRLFIIGDLSFIGFVCVFVL